METSLFSSWDYFPRRKTEMSNFHSFQAKLEDELNFIESLFDPNIFFESLVEPTVATLPSLSTSDTYQNLSSESKIVGRSGICSQLPKGTRQCDEKFLISDQFLDSIDGIIGSKTPASELMLQPPCPSLELQNPAYFSWDEENSTKNSNVVCLSAQSLFARQRRKKISEKTQELSKLVPGGTRMNTAEMLQAAYKYVKYLQAQVSILEYLSNFQEIKLQDCMVPLQILLASSTMQEKLYENEKCLVPKPLVENLVKSEKLPINTSVIKDLEIFAEC